MPAGITFDSWADLWKPELKGKLSAPDFDTSHLVVVAAKLEGGDAATWEKGQDKLKALKPNFKAFYANDAASQQLHAERRGAGAGDAVDERLLHREPGREP